MCTTGLFSAHSPAAPPKGPSAWGAGESCRDTGSPGEVCLRPTALLQVTHRLSSLEESAASQGQDCGAPIYCPIKPVTPQWVTVYQYHLNFWLKLGSGVPCKVKAGQLPEVPIKKTGRMGIGILLMILCGGTPTLFQATQSSVSA